MTTEIKKSILLANNFLIACKNDSTENKNVDLAHNYLNYQMESVFRKDHKTLFPWKNVVLTLSLFSLFK